MQNNVETIFDAFIQDKLNEFTPDVTLLHSSYSSFLAVRQKKKKRRFFWLFFTLLFIVSLFSYYFLAVKKIQNAKSNTLIEPDNLPKKKYSAEDDSLNIVKDNSTKNIAIIDSLYLQPLVSKSNGMLQVGNKDAADKKWHKSNTVTDTTSNKYEVDSILFNIKNRSMSYTINNDSVQKRKTKTAVDTFYIVW